MPAPLPAHVAICRSLDHPNDKLVEMLLAAETARAARRASGLADRAVPVLHAAGHRVHARAKRSASGSSAGCWPTTSTRSSPSIRTCTASPRWPKPFPRGSAVALSAAALFGDVPAAARTRRAARRARRGVGAVAGAPPPAGIASRPPCAASCAAATGTSRSTSRPFDSAGRAVVLVDDMASTGATLAVAARRCLERGAAHGRRAGRPRPVRRRRGRRSAAGRRSPRLEHRQRAAPDERVAAGAAARQCDPGAGCRVVSWRPKGALDECTPQSDAGPARRRIGCRLRDGGHATRCPMGQPAVRRPARRQEPDGDGRLARRLDAPSLRGPDGRFAGRRRRPRRAGVPDAARRWPDSRGPAAARRA